MTDSALIWNCEAICTEKFNCIYSFGVELQMHENGIFFTFVKYLLACHMLQVSSAA